MKNILFCGSYIPNTISVKIKHCSQAANNFQSSLIDGLSKENNLDVLTYISYYEENIGELISSLQQKSINFIIKQLYKRNYFSLFKEYYSLFNKLIYKKDAVVLYNYSYVNLLVNYFCHKNSIKTTLIVADHTESREYASLLRRLLACKYSLDFVKFDNLIFLSEILKSKYDKYKANNFLIEGGVDINKYKLFKPQEVKDELIILYSGVLTKVTGVDIYLKSIRLVENRDVKFIFTGKGELEHLLFEYSKQDDRIIYAGFLDEKEYFQLLNKAHILINPRNMNMPQNMNNFPSKILEYLSTGRVTISTKFPGYHKFSESIIFCESEPVSISNAIMVAVNNYNETYLKQFEINKRKMLQYDWNTQIAKIQEIL